MLFQEPHQCMVLELPACSKSGCYSSAKLHWPAKWSVSNQDWAQATEKEIFVLMHSLNAFLRPLSMHGVGTAGLEQEGVSFLFVVLSVGELAIPVPLPMA